jgi:DNA-directed RNA polymerase specialized sigma24 family protein
MNQLSEEFTLYADDFKRIYQTTVDALREVDSPKYHNDYLFQLLSEINIDHYIDPEDIKQELYLIWIKAIRNYDKTNPPVSKKQYLIRMSVWGLRDWLIKESHTPLYCSDIEYNEEKDRLPFTLDLYFLLVGDEKIFSCLTSYERHLLFLTYVEGKQAIHIAKHLQKDRSIIRRHLDELHKKIGRIIHDKNTTGYCG